MKCIGFILISYPLLAQTPLSLTQALQQAQANRLEVVNGQLQTQLVRSDEARRRARWQPQVSAGADFRWNTQIQRSVIKNAPFANGQDLVLRFGTPINNVLNVQAEQKLYDATSRFDRQINQLAVASQEAALESATVAIRQQVTEAYYLAVFNREKIRLSDRARARAQGYVDQAKTRFQSGTLLQTDLDRFALDLSTAEQTYRNDQRDYALSLDQLRYRINAPKPVAPADSLTTLLVQFQAQTLASGSRVEVKQEELSRQANELNQRREQARLAPVVTAYGAYAAQQFSERFNPVAAQTWFPYNYVGVKVSVPLYDGRQTRLNRQDYGRRVQINQNTVQQFQGDFAYETRLALNTLDQARENLEQARRTITQAQKILAVDHVRFDTGTLLLADYRNSEYSLQQAETNYLRAVYDLLMSQVQVQKAQGNL